MNIIDKKMIKQFAKHTLIIEVLIQTVKRVIDKLETECLLVHFQNR